MKTILYQPIFINPQAYFVFPQLYHIEKGGTDSGCRCEYREVPEKTGTERNKKKRTGHPARWISHRFGGRTCRK